MVAETNDENYDPSAQLNKKKLEIQSNYLDLAAYQLNEQLNQNSRDNILQFISEVGLKVTACSIRMLCSNKQDPKIARLKRENDRTKVFRLIGIQIAFDSIIIHSIFHKRDLKLKAKRLGSISKGVKKRWATKAAFARTLHIYASFFDGVHLIPMNPYQFDQERLENWEENIQNPKMFQKFFGLKKGFETTQQIINQETKALGSNHLFKFDYYRDFMPSYLKRSKKEKIGEKLISELGSDCSELFESFDNIGDADSWSHGDS